MNILILGAGGREAALASSALRANIGVYAVVPHTNPTIATCCEASSGQLLLGTLDASMLQQISKLPIDYAWVSNDNHLYDNWVDKLQQIGIKTIGPSSQAAKIEWDKAYLRQLLATHLPHTNPSYLVINQAEQLHTHLATFTDKQFTIKPLGLSGGKGVKISHIHFENHTEASQYAQQLLQADGAVIIEQYISGLEFTLQCFTDGKTICPPPLTIDYPYRFNGDRGPGTGGMGTCSLANGQLPFVNSTQVSSALSITQTVLDHLADDSYSGVIYPGFFSIPDTHELKVIEFNARPGDPEIINILSLLQTDFAYLIQALHTRSLSKLRLEFHQQASLLVYLVSPEYALGPASPHEFFLDTQALQNGGIEVYFSAAEATDKPNYYRTVGNSRAVALLCRDSTIAACRERLYPALKRHHCQSLDYRTDIGDGIEA